MTIYILNFFIWSNDEFCILGLILLFIFILPAGITTGIAINTKIHKEENYTQAIYKRQVIEYRLEKQDENLVGNELLFEDIVSYNNMLRQHKRFSNNCWLNWFYNDKIATIEYIELDGVKNLPE